MKTFNIYLASKNRKKAEEMGKFLRGLVEFKIYEGYLSPPETGNSFRENAKIKAESLSALISDDYVLSEDSGLIVPHLGGTPGILSHRFSRSGTDEENIKLLLKKMREACGEQRKAYFVSYGILMKGEKIIWEGEERVYGYIAEKAIGEGGFGYDPVFFYPPLGKTFAQLSKEEKNSVSHRGKMLKKLRKFLLSL